jgi:acyl carrier protein
MTEASSAARVKKVLVEELNLNISPDGIADDDLVYAPHIRLDSLGYLRLVHGLEQEFAFEVSAEEVGHILFETVADIVRFSVERCAK